MRYKNGAKERSGGQTSSSYIITLKSAERKDELFDAELNSPRQSIRKVSDYFSKFGTLSNARTPATLG